MSFLSVSDLTASFIYHGKKETVTAGTHVFADGFCAVLETETVCEDAAYLRLILKNTGDQNTAQIQAAKTLDLKVMTEQTPVYHGLIGDDCGIRSFLPVDCQITQNFHEEPLGGRSSAVTGFPFFDVSWEDKTVVCGIGWTGQWSKDILVEADGFRIQAGLCDSDFYLKPGEEVKLASVLIVQGTKAASARRNFRRIMREFYSPFTYLKEDMYLPTSIQCFDRYYQGMGGSDKDDLWATEQGQIRTIEGAKKVKGLDTLWLDAAWFKVGFPQGVGNFCFAEGFPNGLKPVSDKAHAEDMKFVLWFEPERVYQGTELYAQPQMLYQYEQNGNRLLNLGDPAVLAWLKNKLIAMIRENGIDVYRQDFNMSPLPYWRAEDEENRSGISEIRHINGMYELWDALLAEFPKLLIDNCASGGRRLDLETAKRSVTLWKSDTGCFPEIPEQRVTAWSQNQTLTISEYLPYHACAVWETDAYTVRSTATQGVACNFDVLNPAFDYAAAEKILEEAVEMKKYWDGDFYPLSAPTESEEGWIMFRLALADSGAVYVFRREFSGQESEILTISGLEEGAEYQLTFVDEKFARTEKVYSQAELSAGIKITIPERRNSLIILYKKM